MYAGSEAYVGLRHQSAGDISLLLCLSSLCYSWLQTPEPKGPSETQRSMPRQRAVVQRSHASCALQKQDDYVESELGQLSFCVNCCMHFARMHRICSASSAVSVSDQKSTLQALHRDKNACSGTSALCDLLRRQPAAVCQWLTIVNVPCDSVCAENLVWLNFEFNAHIPRHVIVWDLTRPPAPEWRLQADQLGSAPPTFNAWAECDPPEQHIYLQVTFPSPPLPKVLLRSQHVSPGTVACSLQNRW